MTTSVPLREGRYSRDVSASLHDLGRGILIHRPSYRSLAVALLLLGVGPSCAQEPPPPPRTSLAEVQARGELRVVTLNAPTTWYLGTHGEDGLEFLLARDFAAALKVKLRMFPAADAAALRQALLEGRADIAAAQLTHDASWGAEPLPARPYDEVAQQWVYRRGRPRPKIPSQLAELRIVVSESSAQAAILERYAASGVAALQWIVIPRTATIDAYTAVGSGIADLTLADGNDFAFAKPIHPELASAGNLPIRRPVQWIIAPGGADLVTAVDAYFARESRSGRLQQRIAKSTAVGGRMQSVTAREFKELLSERLPALQPHFEQASVQTGFDWRLLAALAYQESQWDPRAVSQNGAQGIMMLMPRTAASLGVKDAFDPRESILAGARYLAQVREQIPARIPEPDRTWFAIAAYNMGYGHVESARVLTQMRGGNADKWIAVRPILPLLSQPEWYSKVKTGYARGWEGQRTVDRVQQFADVLVWRSTHPEPM